MKRVMAFFAALILVACGGSAEAANWYVATTGSDTAAGSIGAPFATIQKASTVAAAGDTVHVAPGTYYGGFVTTASGTSGNKITYQSTVTWGAKLVPDTASSALIGWDQQGSYVDVIGFEVDGQTLNEWRTGLATRGSNVTFRSNYVHHIADAGSCNSQGGAGISNTHYYAGVDVDIIGNVVHNIGLAGCVYYHGIYMQSTGNILNNVVYNVKAAGINLYHDARSVNVSNNTVTEVDMGIYVAGGGAGNPVNGGTAMKRENIFVTNNIVAYNTARGLIETGTMGTSLGTNVFANNLSYGNASADSTVNSRTGTISSEPKFVPSATRFAALQSSSPALNAGSPTYAASTDIDGVTRSVATPDVGAYEY